MFDLLILVCQDEGFSLVGNEFVVEIVTGMIMVSSTRFDICISRSDCHDDINSAGCL